MFFFHKTEVIPQALAAYKWRLPQELQVSLKKSADGGYIAFVDNVPGCVTQAETGQDLFTQVNDALYTYYEIPESYQPYMPIFLPPENVRSELNIHIPEKYLKTNAFVLTAN
ncbi:MAG: type II toxin-antitoxin system HicB family antitoxin [Patescibacteria group bacterium]|nr:type II toxin-antitoxin system HicB family antitoxin [Patescibacteria group bacterium]MCL5261924.1 type II toxin-antitoxin system HicB family antitoxin [Patescibacteria group bacterium]